MQDETQLSSLVKREYKTIDEPYELTHKGKVYRKGFLRKQVVDETKTDKSQLTLFLKLMIIDCFTWFGKEAPTDLILSMSEQIFRTYYWLKITELKLFFERLKGGYWKQMHNFSPAVMMERLKEFGDESMVIREQLSEIEEKKEKPEFNIPFTEEQKAEFSHMLKTLAEKIKRNEEIKASEKIHVNTERDTQFMNENAFCLQFLKDNKIEEKTAVKWHSIFLIRKNK